MSAGFNAGAGRGLRASPSSVARAPFVLALVLVLGMAACGGSGASGSAPGSGAGDGGGGSEPGSEPGSGAQPAGAVIPDRIGNLKLEVVSYRVPDGLAGPGGEQLATMLRALDLTPAAVSLVIAVDRAGLLAIGRWELPGKEANAILAAWKDAAGTSWRSATLGGEPALAGRGPDGSQAWAVARDGVFVYVVTDDPPLAEAAVAGTH